MEDTSATIYDVANAAGVSMATVSRVMNGNPNVKEKTRQKVLAAVDKLDYRPNAIARGLASHKSTTIGVVLPSFVHSYYSRMVVGVDDVARMYDYNILIVNSDGDADKEIMVIDDLISKQVDGLIIMGNSISEQLRGRISRMRTPVVLAGMVDKEEQMPAVTIDHFASVKEAVGLLAKRNQEVLLIIGPMAAAINTVRYDGYKAALKAAKREFSELNVIETTYTYKNGYTLAERVIASGATAAFVTDDEVAAGLLNGLLDNGVSVPEDFEIITANNTIVTKYTRPNLTSIDQPLYDVGAVSMRFLTKIIAHEEIDGKTAILPYKMAMKDSTKK
ncbi:MAG: substrate-binding domain-containing protein [Streptococcaceae bacterium]|jgi:LacI family transcriptional regulator|nr:substrate-binding domain-containing protein [Streptococcaceae bacterium]